MNAKDTIGKYGLAPNVTPDTLCLQEDFEPDWGWNENGRYIYYVGDTESDNIIANVKTREIETNACGWLGDKLLNKIENKLLSLIEKGIVIVK